MNTALRQILVFSIVVLITGTVILSNGPRAYAGLNLSDAGEASCNGTLGGGQLSKSQLDDICRNYKENSTKNDSPAVIIEVVKGIALLSLGAVLGVLFTRNKRKAVKK